MELLESLRFVQGAVSKKDFVPALTHFQIRNGRVTGFNGKISLSAPIALDIDCQPKADTFVNAVEACTETAQLSLTASGKLSIRSGRFRAHVDILKEDSFPEVLPEGQRIDLHWDPLAAMKLLYDFTAEDASRPWAAGLLLDGTYIYATNNVILVQHAIGDFFPFRINIPRYTIKEMLRIGETPIAMQVSHGSVTFHYEGNRWLRSQQNSLDWPDTEALFRAAEIPSWHESMLEVPEALFEALDTLAPFVQPSGKLWIGSGRVATAEQDGASIDLDLPECSFNHKMLLSLRGVAKKMAFASWPKPVMFYGDKLRGMIAGMR